MKKIIFLLIALVTVTFAIAQERTVSITMPTNNTYYKYSGVAADVLVSTTTDTIDVVFQYQGSGYIEKIAIKSRFDMRTTADTTVAISVFGKEFADDGTYVEVIASALSAVVTTDNVVKVSVNDPYVTDASHTLTDNLGATATESVHTITPFDKCYRYYRVRYILSGNDSVGTGVKLDEVEFKVYTKN